MSKNSFGRVKSGGQPVDDLLILLLAQGNIAAVQIAKGACSGLELPGKLF